MFEYKLFTKAVIKANKQIYEYINTHMSFNDLNETSNIGYGGDKTLKIDLVAENIFIKHLSCFGDIFQKKQEKYQINQI